MYDYQKRKLKRELSDLYDIFLDYECYLAGGAITSIFTNKDINDYDIFFVLKEDIVRFLNKESYGTNFKSDYAITIAKNGKTIQLIYKHEYPTAQDVLNSFDFSVCMGCYDFSTEEFVLGDIFLEDLAINTMEVGIPFDYFEYNDEYYTLDFKHLDKEKVDKCIFARKKPIEEIVKLPMTVYKWIDAKNHCSFFNSNFKWKDYGEVKTNDWFASSHGLHFVTEDKIWTCCYSNYSNKALVRGIVTSYDDFISVNDMNAKSLEMKLERVFVTNIWNEEDIPEEIKSKKKEKQENCLF